jgi:hypothetical protein
MSGEHEIDKSFPYFEEHNFSGWLIQFKAMLREHDCDEIIETPIPKDVDANGNPIPMNARERKDFNRELRAHKEKDKIAYARIMKACRLNLKTKLLCESGTLKTANDILARLRQRLHSVDETMKASHLLRYSSLKQHFTREKVPLLHTEPGCSDPPTHSRCPPLAFPPRPVCGRRPEAN